MYLQELLSSLEQLRIYALQKVTGLQLTDENGKLVRSLCQCKVLNCNSKQTCINIRFFSIIAGSDDMQELNAKWDKKIKIILKIALSVIVLCSNFPTSKLVSY